MKKIPKNLEDCLIIIKEKYLSEEDIKVIKKPNSSSSSIHFGFGMFLRNEWLLWNKKTKLVKWFKKEYDIDHADDISGLILKALWSDIRKEPRNDKLIAESYVNYWKKMKIMEKNGIHTFKIIYNDDGTFELK